jgi:hypothetical protein
MGEAEALNACRNVDRSRYIVRPGKTRTVVDNPEAILTTKTSELGVEDMHIYLQEGESLVRYMWRYLAAHREASGKAAADYAKPESRTMRGLGAGVKLEAGGGPVRPVVGLFARRLRLLNSVN